jgi:hypothetical protein
MALTPPLSQPFLRQGMLWEKGEELLTPQAGDYEPRARQEE